MDGRNVLAVAIKQGATSSTDAAFMMTLYGRESNVEKETGLLKKLSGSYGLLVLMLAIACLGVSAVVFYRRRRKSLVEGEYRINKGHSYLLLEEEGGKVGSKLFSTEMSKDEYEGGLYITRGNPDEAKKELGDSRVTVMWLTGVETAKSVEGSINPILLDISVVVNKFTSEHSNALILFDGLQYLINKIGLETILEFLSNLKDRVSQRNAVLILPVVRMALEPKELGLLETELEVLKPRGEPESKKKAKIQTPAGSKEVLRDI